MTPLESLPSRGAWIEMHAIRQVNRALKSLPSRGAWIEIGCPGCSASRRPVAPLAGSVDRNIIPHLRQNKSPRSLPSRGAWIEIAYFQRKISDSALSLPSRGAWIEICLPRSYLYPAPSLPSRGAWIEITCSRVGPRRAARVAPLAGSVDRNPHGSGRVIGRKAVAPLAGSVDRNSCCFLGTCLVYRRSPRGERG